MKTEISKVLSVAGAAISILEGRDPLEPSGSKEARVLKNTEKEIDKLLKQGWKEYYSTDKPRVPKEGETIMWTTAVYLNKQQNLTFARMNVEATVARAFQPITVSRDIISQAQSRDYGKNYVFLGYFYK